jgi:hypothetical protein
LGFTRGCSRIRSCSTRLRLASIKDKISEQYFHVPPGTTLTLCVLTLWNGYTVVGESACASPENFDEEIGRRLAFNNAFNKIWALEGYRLRTDLHGGGIMTNDFGWLVRVGDADSGLGAGQCLGVQRGAASIRRGG